MSPRLAPLLVALVAACAHQRPHIGGTPGPPAIACAADDPTCLEVQQVLERVRGNIGGWCGTTQAMGHQTLLVRGPETVPHLERALADRDADVAAFAARLLIDHGAGDRVIAWCAAHTRPPNACADLRVEAARTARLPVVGTWSGHLVSLADADATAVTLRLRRDPNILTGELCIEARGCVPLERAALVGSLLSVRYPASDPGAATEMLMKIGVDTRGAAFAECLTCDARLTLQRL